MNSDLPFARHSVLPPVARPPVLHGLAVAGIIIAALSFIASLLVAAYGAGVYLNSTAARNRLLRNAPVDLPASSPSQPVLYSAPIGTTVGLRGLESNQRVVIVEAISQRIEMTAAQAQQFDALLAEVGADMFSLSRGQAVDPQAILQTIADHVGRLPSTAEGTEPFFFETPAGRAEVYENRALLFLHGRLSPVRVTAGRRMNSTGHPILLPQDVNRLIRLAQNACQQGTSRPSMLGDPQVQTLQSLLSDPQQRLASLVPSPDGNVVGLNGASVRPDGYATIDFAGGAVMLGPRGNVILRSDREAIPAVSGFACGLVVFEGLASAALAVLLLLFCLSLIRLPRERLNRMVLWAVAELGLSLVGGAAVAWMTASYLSTALTSRTPSAGNMATSLALGVAVALVGIVFPIIVLLVARSRAVREYFNPRE
ncbi:MAG TPA: hypothetical protein VGI81_11305 [Tepidisphaeraceae bacterium]